MWKVAANKWFFYFNSLFTNDFPHIIFIVASPSKWLLSLDEASVRLGHKSLRTLMKRSSSWYLPGCRNLINYQRQPGNEIQE
jgi:hypothetical protein